MLTIAHISPAVQRDKVRELWEMIKPNMEQRDTERAKKVHNIKSKSNDRTHDNAGSA